MGYYMGDYYAAGGPVSGFARKVMAVAKGPTGKKMLKAGAGLIRRKLKGRKILRGGPRKHHRMNALNPRALRRAIRRTHSFAKFARKVMTFQAHHKFKKGRWGGTHRKAKG